MADEQLKPQATVRIEKTIKNAPVGEDDMELMEETTPKKPGRLSKKSSVVDDETGEDEFNSLLQDHTIKIHVDRVSPREWRGKQISGMIEEYVPPTTQEEIETDIRSRFGGGRYRVRILKNGRFLGARGISIYGDPKIQEEQFEPGAGEDFEGMPFRDGPVGPPMIDDEITSLKKDIEKERLKKILQEVKGDGNPNAHQAVNPEVIRREAEERTRRDMKFETDLRDVRTEVDKKLDGFLNNLKDTLRSQKETDPARDSDIVALDNKVERLKTDIMADVRASISELKGLLTQPKPEKPDSTPQLFSALIDGFSKMNQSSEAKLSAIADAEKSKTQAMMTSMQAINDANARVSQAQTDKLVTVIQSQRSEGGVDGIAKTVSAVRDIAESMGLGPANQEAAEPPDVMSRILGMVEKALPSLLAAQKVKAERGGQQLTKQEIEQIIANQARQAARQIAPAVAQQAAMMRQQAANQGGNAQVTPPQSPIQASQQAYAQARQRAQQQTIQPPAAPPAPPLVRQEQAVPQPAPQVPSGEGGGEAAPTQAETEVPAVIPVHPETPEQVSEIDKADIVNDCIDKLLREIRIRPRVQSWNEYAFDNLPEDVLEKLVLAMDADGVVNSIREYTSQDRLNALEEILKDNQRAVDWLVKGLNEIKEFYAQDDGTEEEGEEEEVEEETSKEASDPGKEPA